MELQELIERIEQWKLRTAGEADDAADGASNDYLEDTGAAFMETDEAAGEDFEEAESVSEERYDALEVTEEADSGILEALADEEEPQDDSPVEDETADSDDAFAGEETADDMIEFESDDSDDDEASEDGIDETPEDR